MWLYPDPHGGAFLWPCAQTALPADCLTRVDDKGSLPAEVWLRVYNVIVENRRNAMRVDGSGGGGRSRNLTFSPSHALAGYFAAWILV